MLSLLFGAWHVYKPLAFPATTCRVGAGGVRTLIALHHGRRVQRKVSRLHPVAVESSKVFSGLRDSRYSSVTNSLLGGN